jgi:Ser/Thr protein kinase RdoA (MazF antagonist)
MVMNDNCKEDSKNQRDALPVAILHGDLFLENILFQPDGELDAIIDWECICIGERLMDVTMTLVGCCYDSTDTLSISHATAFLSSYQNILSLTSREREYFETFLCYSLLSIACYRWHRFNVRFPADHRSTSYLPMLKRLNDINSKVVQQLLAA